MIVGIISSLAASAFVLIVTIGWRNRRTLIIYFVGTLLARNSNIRVSMAVLLRVQEGDKYLLFHTPFTPNTYGPPGGVVKFTQAARPILDRLEFRDQVHPAFRRDMTHDLRGFIPGRSLPAFIRWFQSGHDRESSIDCLRRELREELHELGRPDVIGYAADLDFRFVRSVMQDPKRVSGESYRQFRIIEVYDLETITHEGEQARKRLLAVGRSNDRATLANSDEIRRGRSHSLLIGSQACFLLGSKPLREDLPSIRLRNGMWCRRL